jgi:GH24 family phage-related lysozyme (muramidase)
MVTVNLAKLEAQLTNEEGRKNKAYVDTLGILSIGIGRNLRDNGLRDSEIDFLFKNDVEDVKNAIQAHMPWVLDLDEVRQRVFYDLCFNMGVNKLLTFTHMIAFARAGDYISAADELHHSIWDSQVGSRAPKLEAMLRTGEDQ